MSEVAPNSGGIAPSALAFLVSLGWGAGALRWLVEGDHKLYSQWGRTLYLPDPELEWRRVEWLGLWLGADALLVIALLGLCVALLRRFPRGRPFAPVAALACLLLGFGLWFQAPIPAKARLHAPSQLIELGEGVQGGIQGAGPAGTWTSTNSDLRVEIDAGGESFEARFELKEGTWTGDPKDMTQPMRANFVAVVGSLDSGLKGRDRHALQYLQSDRFPEIELQLEGLERAGPSQKSAQVNPVDAVDFEARARFLLMGQASPIRCTGRLRAPGPRELTLDAEMELDLRETALADRASSFDDPIVRVRLQSELQPSTSALGTKSNAAELMQ